MPNTPRDLTPGVSELIAMPEWEERYPESRCPDFSLKERLQSHAGEITPEDFRRIADETLQEVYGCELTIAEDYTFPMDEEPDDDILWLTERNLMRMENFLKDQIAGQQDHAQIRQDLICLDRYLNTYLRRRFVDPEEVDLELADYFARFLLDLDPIPPFEPEFGMISRFYSWMMDDPLLKDTVNWEGVSTQKVCQHLLSSLRLNIPYLLRLREIAVGSEESTPEAGSRRHSGRSGQTLNLSPAFARLEHWQKEQLTANRKILARFRKDLEKEPGWSDPEDRHFAVRLAEIYLTETLPDLAYRADQVPLHLSTYVRDVRKIIVEEGVSEDLPLLAKTAQMLIVSLIEQGIVSADLSKQDWDPWYPILMNSIETPDETFPARNWQAERSPDLYEDNLSWQTWNVGRNRLFLQAFRDDLISTGMEGERTNEHVRRVRDLMGKLLEVEGCSMENLPEGLEDLLGGEDDTYRHEWTPEGLRKGVGSLRRFYRSMMRLEYLSPQTGDELLAFLKRRTGDWVAAMKASQGLS